MKLSSLLACVLCAVACLLYTGVLVECNSKLPNELRERLDPTPSDEEDSDSSNEDTSCTDCQPSVPTELPCDLRVEGCIITNAFGLRQWYPDPCTLCDCNGCSKIICPELDCFEFPTVKKVGKCCPECDFGASKYNCSVVPVKIQSLYVSLGDKSFQKDVIVHDCNQKFGVEENGQLFGCVPLKAHFTHKLEQEVRENTGIYKIGYVDVGRCKKLSFDSLSSEERVTFLLQMPQDVTGGREDNGLPQRCVEYFARQDELQP